MSLEERSITSDHTVHSKSIQITQQLIPPAMRINGGQPVGVVISPLGTPQTVRKTSTQVIFVLD